MQVFEIIDLKRYPYLQTKEVTEGKKVKDIITAEDNEEKVFLLVSHDSKQIWIYNCNKSPIKLQVFGSILAGMVRKQLKVTYRIFSLNSIKESSKEFQDIAKKSLGGGPARAIEEIDFPKQDSEGINNPYIKIDTNVRAHEALELTSALPSPAPDIYLKRLVISSGTVYSEEEITESFLKDEKSIIKPIKLGQLNNGFSFFDDHDYSTRLIIKDRKVQAIELFIRKEDKSPPLELEVPTIPDDNIGTIGNISDILNSFKILDKLPENEETQN